MLSIILIVIVSVFYLGIATSLYQDFIDVSYKPNHWLKIFGGIVSALYAIVILIVSPYYCGVYLVNKILDK